MWKWTGRFSEGKWGKKGRGKQMRQARKKVPSILLCCVDVAGFLDMYGFAPPCRPAVRSSAVCWCEFFWTKSTWVAEQLIVHKCILGQTSLSEVSGMAGAMLKHATQQAVCLNEVLSVVNSSGIARPRTFPPEPDQPKWSHSLRQQTTEKRRGEGQDWSVGPCTGKHKLVLVQRILKSIPKL